LSHDACVYNYYLRLTKNFTGPSYQALNVSKGWRWGWNRRCFLCKIKKKRYKSHPKSFYDI